MPLWGLGARAPFLHDGRAANIEQAIDFHAGEAETSRLLYQDLTEEERLDLLAFLKSL